MILQKGDIEKYVPLQTSSFNFDNYAGFEIRALYKHFTKFLGITLIDELTGDNPDDDLVKRIIPVLANLTVLESIPFLDVVLTSSGFGVVRNNNIAPASRERVQSFAMGCKNAANDFMDILLLFLENNTDKYSSWNKSSLNSESLLPNTVVFNELTRLNLKQHEFVDIRTYISVLETTSFTQALSPEFIAELIAGSDTTLKPMLQKALAFLAYHEYIKEIDPETNRNQWKMQGVKFFDKAISFLISNLTNYPTYETFGYEAPYDNDNEDNIDSGFFIAGATA